VRNLSENRISPMKTDKVFTGVQFLSIKKFSYETNYALRLRKIFYAKKMTEQKISLAHTPGKEKIKYTLYEKFIFALYK
jgi:hypothetical protein